MDNPYGVQTARALWLAYGWECPISGDRMARGDDTSSLTDILGEETDE